jgi:hypothetical protein
MIESYIKNWSDTIPLSVYNEDFVIDCPKVINMGWQLGNDYNNFCQRWDQPENRKILTFAKKAYSIIDAMKNIDCDRLIWIDSDCIIKKQLSDDIIDEIMPESKLASYFGVWHTQDGREYFSCETGFFVLNKNHPAFDYFSTVYSNIYNTDDYDNLRRFYDGEVFGETVTRLSDLGIDMLNLSPVDKKNKKKYKTPIKRSLLKDYIDHYKAGSKKYMSNESDGI